jgi:hypothetical protein
MQSPLTHGQALADTAREAAAAGDPLDCVVLCGCLSQWTAGAAARPA